MGVDVFFVISGYLITTVIWREALKEEFSIIRFYERRFRRIMPALLALLIVVSGLAFALLLPIDLDDYARSVFASLTFVGNVYFWRSVADYFAQLATEKPLLNLWSLGVEEQFYIFFPIFVVLCTKLRKSLLLPFTALLVAVSFAANVFALRIGAATPAFYLLPSRAWEIGAGCLLALTPLVELRRKWLRQMLGTLAAVLLAVGLLFNGAHLLSASLPPAIWVVLGATLTIYLGEPGGDWLTSLLSLPAMTFVGLLSYSLYLWHWPLLVFTRYYLVISEIAVLQAAVLMVLMFGLAILSWKYVERPFRNRSMPIARVVAWTACACAVVVAFSSGVLRANGFSSRYSPAVAKINAAVGSEYRCGLREVFPFGAYRACLMAAPGKDPAVASVALVGNSHAQMYAPLVSDILRENHLAGIMVPLNGCLPIPDFNLSTSCMNQAATNLKAVERLPRVRVVILAMTWDLSQAMFTPKGPVPTTTEGSAFCESLDRVIEELRQSGKSVILVGPLAIPGYDVASIVARQMAFGRPVTEPMYMPEMEFLDSNRDILSHYSSRNDMTFIRPDQAQCQKSKCDFFRDGMSIFADASHLSQGSLGIFRPIFEPVLKQVFAVDHM